MTQVFNLSGVLIVLFCGVGCSADSRSMVAVRGRLVYHLGTSTPPTGKTLPTPLKKSINVAEPVPGASLSFIPIDSASAQGEARTDDQGCFAVEVPSRGVGLPVGSYRVVVKLPDSYKKTVAPTYASSEHSPLLVRVPKEGAEKIQLELRKE